MHLVTLVYLLCSGNYMLENVDFPCFWQKRDQSAEKRPICICALKISKHFTSFYMDELKGEEPGECKSKIWMLHFCLREKLCKYYQLFLPAMEGLIQRFELSSWKFVW